jgi:hypothetical protein
LGTFVADVHEHHLKEHSDRQYTAWSARLKRKAYVVLRDIIMASFLPNENTNIPFLGTPTKSWPLQPSELGKSQLPARIILAGKENSWKILMFRWME